MKSSLSCMANCCCWLLAVVLLVQLEIRSSSSVHAFAPPVHHLQCLTRSNANAHANAKQTTTTVTSLQVLPGLQFRRESRVASTVVTTTTTTTLYGKKEADVDDDDDNDKDDLVMDSFDAQGFGGYLAPYALAVVASVVVTAAFFKFVLLDYWTKLNWRCITTSLFLCETVWNYSCWDKVCWQKTKSPPTSCVRSERTSYVLKKKLCVDIQNCWMDWFALKPCRKTSSVGRTRHAVVAIWSDHPFSDAQSQHELPRVRFGNRNRSRNFSCFLIGKRPGITDSRQDVVVQILEQMKNSARVLFQDRFVLAERNRSISETHMIHSQTDSWRRMSCWRINWTLNHRWMKSCRLDNIRFATPVLLNQAWQSRKYVGYCSLIQRPR